MSYTRRYAITFGEVAISHIGGAEYGAACDELGAVSVPVARRRENGFSPDELRAAAETINNSADAQGVRAEVVDLAAVLPEEVRNQHPDHDAVVLVVRNGVRVICQNAEVSDTCSVDVRNFADELYEEQLSAVQYDEKYYDGKRKKTLNKQARYNVVFGDLAQVASEDYKQCTVACFDDLPRLKAARDGIGRLLGEAGRNLPAEGNQYHKGSSGIGFHGDSERKIVICVSLGKSSILRYHWRLPHSSEHTFAPIDICVNHGDVYVMSEKATGWDWRLRSKLRLVHGAGSQRYIGQDAEANAIVSAVGESSESGNSDNVNTEDTAAPAQVKVKRARTKDLKELGA